MGRLLFKGCPSVVVHHLDKTVRMISSENINTMKSDTCPHIPHGPISSALEEALPYSKVPGPKPLPLLGNTWRLLPIIGQYKVSDVAKISQLFYQHYGKIVRLTGLIGRPDLLFVYDADEIEKVYRQEGPTPFRPSMPCLVHYKSIVRKDFFGALPGVVGVHGEPWREFRTRVQKPVLQPRTVRKYITPIEVVTNDFIQRMEDIKREDGELPADYDNEVHKWALECIGRVALDVRLGCLGPDLAPNSEPQKIIDAAKYALRNVAVLELKAPFWRYIPTPLWTRYVRNMDYFIEFTIRPKHLDAINFRSRVLTLRDSFNPKEQPTALAMKYNDFSLKMKFNAHPAISFTCYLRSRVLTLQDSFKPEEQPTDLAMKDNDFRYTIRLKHLDAIHFRSRVLKFRDSFKPKEQPTDLAMKDNDFRFKMKFNAHPAISFTCYLRICMKHIDAAMERLKSKKSVDEQDLSLVERILASETDPKMAYILALDLILVGIDTISMAVCSILYQLATRPEEQEKIHQELLKILPDPSVPLTTTHLDQAVYMKAFIKEVFRVYSTVIGNGRTLQNDTVICGYKVPKGVQVVFPTLVTGNMEEYVDDAETFKPERWLKEGSDQKLHPFASLPYGYGARMCLGRRFADLEMQVLLAKLIRSHKLEYHHEPLKYKVTFMYAPDGELKFKFLKR